jgi:hypothetical protein
MAFGTDFHFNVRFGGTDGHFESAGAFNGGLLEFWMDFRLHGYSNLTVSFFLIG